MGKTIIQNIITASWLFFDDHCIIASDQYVSYNSLYQAYAEYLRHVVPNDQLLTYKFMKNPAKIFSRLCTYFSWSNNCGYRHAKMDRAYVDPNILEKTTILSMKQRNRSVDRVLNEILDEKGANA